MGELGSILTLNEDERQALSYYGLAVFVTLLLCVISNSRVIRLAGTIVSVGWLFSVGIYLVFRDDGGPALALQGTIISLVFYWLWRHATANNAPLFRRLFWIHSAYALAAGYRLIGELWFPDSMMAQYYLQQFIQNRLFDLTLVYLIAVSIIRLNATRKTENKTNASTQEQNHDPKYTGPRWLINLLIAISNDEKPDSEHIPLVEQDKMPAAQKRLNHQPIAPKKIE